MSVPLSQPLISHSPADPEPIFVLQPHLFVTHLSFLSWSIFSLSSHGETGSSYLVRSLTAYSPGVFYRIPRHRRHYRWRALNVFCLFHFLLFPRLSSVTLERTPILRNYSHPPSHPVWTDVLAGVALTWISYPVAFDNGKAAGSFVLRRNCRQLKNQVTYVSFSR